MEINHHPYVFQTDSNIVQKVYNESDNFLIQYNENGSQKDYCAIYFSSNDIYFPNTEYFFQKRIIDKNFFEWYRLRITKAHKHIFVRDIMKQWHLSGINSRINTPEKLLAFLRKETSGYKIITVGSSAGGYAAVLYGSLLQADRIFSFNCQFELRSLLTNSNEKINPLVFRFANLPVSKFYDLKPFINSTSKIYYFFSSKSINDIRQQQHIHNTKGIKTISFQTAHHGIPFPKCALPVVINMQKKELEKLTKKRQSPLLFSVKLVGIINTIVGLYQQILQSYRKRR
jgi:hypothetical protein